MDTDWSTNPIEAMKQQHMVIQRARQHIEDIESLLLADAATIVSLRSRVAKLEAELTEVYVDAMKRWSGLRGGDWLQPAMRDSEHAATKLLAMGWLEKHPDREWYRFTKEAK